MGSALAVGLILLIVLVVVGGAFFLGGLGSSASKGRVDVEGGATAVQHVRYEVPEGQDPAVVMAALEQAGFDAVPDTETPRQVVTVVLGERPHEDRERVREAIAGSRSTNLGGPDVLPDAPVRFLDETPGTAR